MPTQRTTGTFSGTGKHKPPLLTEEQIVDAALSVIRKEGLEALSMRRLSRELGRSAMAPYWYVEDKQQLLNLVAKKLLAEVPLPSPGSGSWEAQLREIVGAIDARLRDHPGIAEILLQRMVSTDRRLMNGIMEILMSAGFAGPEVFLAYAMIHTYLFGRYQVVLHADEFPDPTSDADGLDDALAALLPHLLPLRGRDFFAFGLDMIVAGLRSYVEAKSQP